MAQYSIADIIGKTLYPNTTLNVYDHPDGNVIGTVTPPNPAGVVYSWVTGAGGAIWWMFQGNNSNLANQYGSYYILQAPGVFNVQALTQQGVITIAQKIAQQKAQNESTFQKIEDMVKWLALTILGGIITKSVLDTWITKKSKK